jgi:transcriptional regulator with XRE-family HTH domain
MNFGDKLKQIRMDRNLTQPQLAAAIGIEQSYLSKLENDKSQPSAETFDAIVKALDMAPKDFLSDIDKRELQGPLRHIPEVSQFLNGTAAQRVHDARKWLFGGAAGLVLGFALLFAAREGTFSANDRYTYVSKGVILNHESDAVFEQFKEILSLKWQANILSKEDMLKALAEFEANRVKVSTVVMWGGRGKVFFDEVANGRRKYELDGITQMRAPVNIALQYLGGLLAFCGVLAFFLEWRLRRAGMVIHKDLKTA